MKAEFRITEDDYAKAMQLHQWRGVLRWPSVIRVITGLIAVIVLVALILLIIGDATPLIFFEVLLASAALYAVLLVGFLVTHRYTSLPYTARRTYRQYKAIQEPMAIELTDDGLRFSGASGETTLRWLMIFQWCQNDQFVLIYAAPMLFYALPKSLAQQGFDIPVLVQRLAEHVGPER